MVFSHLGFWSGNLFLIAPFPDLCLLVPFYYKRDDFDFDKVNFPFLDVDVPRRTSYGVYIPQFIRFARKVQVGKDQEKAQSEKDSHSKNQDGKKNQTNNQVLIP